jgi:hypothetical protein
VLVALGVTGTKKKDLNAFVEVGEIVGSEVVSSDKGSAVTTGGGATIIPIAPIITRANPLAKLMIKNLGYFIRT